MADDDTRLILGPNISVDVTDRAGRTVNLSKFGTILSGDIADVGREIELQYRYRISFTFGQAPQGAEALRQMAVPLTVACAVFSESGEARQYEYSAAWLNYLSDRTVIFAAKGKTSSV